MIVFEKRGGEITVNSTYARTQAQSQVATLADGRFIVAWVDADPVVFANRYLRAQVFEADGTAVGGEMTLSGPVNWLKEASITGLEGGGFVTVWRDVMTLRVQRYDDSGAPAGPAIAISTSQSMGVAEAVATAGGGFAIAWSDDVQENTTVHLQTFDASGVASSGNVTVNGSTIDNAARFAKVSVAALDGGNIVVTWYDINGEPSADNQYMARIYTAAGVPLGAEFAVNLNPATNYVGYGEAPVVALANGNFAISWTELDPSFAPVNRIQIFTASGERVGSPIVTAIPWGASYAYDSPVLAALADGSMAVVYHAGVADKYVVRVFSIDGAPLSQPVTIETQANGEQSEPSITALADGGFVVTWTDYNGAGSDDDQVKAQVFGPAVDAVTITSYGGAATATALASENDLAAGLVTAVGADGPLTFAIAGGADAALFAIDASTGALSFVAAPDYEAPGDANGDNVYQVIVGASDGTSEDTQALSVSVSNRNDNTPVISVYPGSSAVIDLAENTGLVDDFAATDADGLPLTFSLTGQDANRFSVNATTGLVQFLAAPDYEAPGSSAGTNTYVFTLVASDGVFSDTLDLTVNVTDVADVIHIVSNGGGDTAAFSLAENQTVATTVFALDAAGPQIVYAIAGGSDASRFAIDAATGVLSFVTAPNYEAPNDVGANRVYDVVVAASDGSLTDTQALAITITNVNEAPIITSNGGGASAVVGVNENSTFVTFVNSTDPENATRTYSIVGGADAARFSINFSTGGMSFVSITNFESPTDVGGDNVYDVIVQASDGSLVDTQAIAVAVTDSDEAPVITSNGGGATAAVSVNENTTFVTTVTSTDPENVARAYSISGGADASRFAIDAATGVLSFVSAPNRESAIDVGANNVYDVIVRASDGWNTDTQAIAVTVNNVNETPVITSNGGGATAAISVGENSASAITTVTSTDPENTARTYSIVGGADAARFSIISNTGVLTFFSVANFEAPADADANNVYEVIVRASDGSLWDEQALSITVTNLNEVPFITSNGGGVTAAITVNENSVAVTTVTATDPDNTAPTYSISGGTDSSRFTINANTGVLTFVTAPNREAPVDSNGDNVYNVIVRASDGSWTDTQSIAITVANVNEAVTITSGSAFSVAENGLAVTTVTATDLDGTAPSYSITGGADAALFAINAASGALSFVAAPDFESPADAGANNVYDVVITASDGLLSDSRALAVTVTNANEAPVITSNGGEATAEVAVNEGSVVVTTVTSTDPENTARTYSISGGADAARFTIGASGGALRFVAAPNFEAPADADGDNVYVVTVRASDGVLTDTQTLSVTVANVNEAPVITSNGGGFTASVATSENATAVTTVLASDVDSGVSYAIAGGADAVLFAVDATTGALSFLAAPDFEAPADADANNVYQVVVSASDGSLADTQTLSITVTDVSEAPEFHPAADWSVTENESYIGTVQALDPEGQGMTYFVAGGADGELFQVDPLTGEFGFLDAADFEAPGDADGDNVYELEIGVVDNDFIVTSAIHVTVADIVETLTFAQTSFDGMENVSEIATLSAAGGDPAVPVSYSIAGGADAALFGIDAESGALTFLVPQDFEAPADADADNLYEVRVAASNGSVGGTETVFVSLLGYDEDPTIEAPAFAVSEGDIAVGTVAAADPENASLSFGLAEGFDGALFTIDAESGALSFLAAPDFEAPGDADGDNVYQVSVTVSDGENQTTTWQPVSIAVSNVNEAPAIVSDGGGTAAVLAIGENDTAVTAVAAEDPDGGVTYAIAGGADAALFAIDASTGALSFAAGPDFEAPGDADGDNLYEVVVGASDGSLSDSQALSVAITDADEAPVFTSSASIALNENAVVVTTVAAVDPEQATLAFAITGGADAAQFAIDAATGALRFVAAPDFEAAGDAGGDNVYQVTVAASDGANSVSQALSVTVGDANEAPVITSGGGGDFAPYLIAEGSTVVATVVASDPDGGQSLFYSILGGATDWPLFTIDSASGVLAFIAAPDFEAPGQDNVYTFGVAVSDGGGLYDVQTISVHVGNVNEAPVITSPASIALSENESAVTAVEAVDPDSEVTYAIVGGADAALFEIDPWSGELVFIAAPDFDAPADAGANNVYDVVVDASDGSLSDARALAITVGNVNEAPVIGSPAAWTVSENGTAVGTIAASDPEHGALTYRITGGADAARFTINAATGALAFAQAPNFEAPADAGGDNVYALAIEASDGTLVAGQALTVTVGNVFELPVITSGGGGSTAAYAVAENATAVATIAATGPEGPVTYTLAGGADAALFAIDSATGALRFLVAPDYDAPADANHDNVYQVAVGAGYGNLGDTQVLTVTVGNLVDGLTLIGTSGANTLNGSYEEDTINGLAGNDTLNGLGAADTIDGGDGQDRITGGAGADLLTGGLKADTFAYGALDESTLAASDRILDFSHSQGDRIDLSAIDARTTLGGNQAFSFIGSAAFSNQAGQLRAFVQSGDTVIQADVNGDGLADFQLLVDPPLALVAADFVL
jgi:hypothetical protein